MRKMEISNKLAFICLFLFTFCGFAHANKIIYVDDDATGANDGSSWQNAYIYLQDALADADNSEKPVEIRVAQGTYKPDQGTGQTAGDREATFRLTGGLHYQEDTPVFSSLIQMKRLSKIRNNPYRRLSWE